jgi:hypothetical protein
LLPARGVTKGDRMTHRIALEDVSDIDVEVRRWLTEAYRRGA